MFAQTSVPRATCGRQLGSERSVAAFPFEPPREPRISRITLAVPKRADRVSVDFPEPFGPATTWSVGMARCIAGLDQANLRSAGLMIRSPFLVLAM